MSVVHYGGPVGGATVVTTGHYPTPAQPNVFVVQSNPMQRIPGMCPYCGVGQPRDEFTLLGIILAIFLFPLGIICCLAMKEKRCAHCNAVV